MPWPCCDVLGRGASGQRPVHDRRSRFLVDPREQWAAQRWARDRHQRCLGGAPSHPASEPVPSPQDRRLGQTDSTDAEPLCLSWPAALVATSGPQCG